MPALLSTHWRHRFAVLTVAITLALIGAGGLVTSRGVGMAVPDWPNTYGYNMFFFPVSQWVGGVFYEHTHRLIASGVGLLTTILALWLYGRKARLFLRWSGVVVLAVGVGTGLALSRHWADGVVAGLTGLAAFGASFVWPRCEPSPRWLRWLGLAALMVVVVQGVLGGLRVVLFKDQIGIFHATLAQLFFALTCALALFTSGWWEAKSSSSTSLSSNQEGESRTRTRDDKGVVVWVALVGTTVLILGQLILGATMRHQHAGLAIPDFPLAYGKVWPAMDTASVAKYNRQRMEIAEANPITAAQVALQMAHRGMAVLVLVAVGGCAWLARRRLGAEAAVSRGALVWLGLIVVQVLLGAATIWSNKAADVATVHVLVGAVSLALGVLLSIVTFQGLRFGLKRQRVIGPADLESPKDFVPRPV